MSLYREVEVEIEDDDIGEYLDGLTETQIKRFAKYVSAETVERLSKAKNVDARLNIKSDWDDIERALERKDWATLEIILWREVRDRQPRPKLKPIGA